MNKETEEKKGEAVILREKETASISEIITILNNQ